MFYTKIIKKNQDSKSVQVPNKKRDSLIALLDEARVPEQYKTAFLEAYDGIVTLIAATEKTVTITITPDGQALYKES